MSFITIANKLAAGIVEHAPTIATSIGMGSMVAGTVEGIKATPSAYEEYKKLKDGESPRTADYLDLGLRHYWKCGILTIGGVILIGIGHKADLTKLAVATAALQMKDEDSKDYKKAVEKIVGKKKSEEIEERYCKDKAEGLRNIDVDSANIIHTGNGNILCYDIPSKTVFYSSYAALVHAKQQVVGLIESNGYASLNDLYDFLGIGYFKLAEGKSWYREPGYSSNDAVADIKIYSMPIEINGEMRPVFTIDHFADEYPDILESDRY